MQLAITKNRDLAWDNDSRRKLIELFFGSRIILNYVDYVPVDTGV